MIKQSSGIHSKSVLVSSIFEKNDEQGVEDCLSTAGFQIFGFLYQPKNRNTGRCEFRRRPAVEHRSSENEYLQIFIAPSKASVHQPKAAYPLADMKILDTLRVFHCFDLIEFKNQTGPPRCAAAPNIFSTLFRSGNTLTGTVLPVYT